MKFVLTIDRTFHAVMKKVIRWALVPFEKSLGQPTLPHLVVAINQTGTNIDGNQWDYMKATRSILIEMDSLIHTDTELRGYVEKWRTYGKEIKDTEALLNCYYSSVWFVRLPATGDCRHTLLHKQMNKLHSVITESCARSHYWKKRTGMLSNSEDLQVYLQHAYDHFSKNLDDPFDFIKVGLEIRPIPSDFGGNIAKLAVAVHHHQPSIDFGNIFYKLSVIVASCIMLDIQRHNRLGMWPNLQQPPTLSRMFRNLDMFVKMNGFYKNSEICKTD